jgi:hypothetical protein
MSEATAQRWLSEESKPNMIAMRLLALHRHCSVKQIEDAFRMAEREYGALTSLELRSKQDQLGAEDFQNMLRNRAILEEFIENCVEKILVKHNTTLT